MTVLFGTKPTATSYTGPVAFKMTVLRPIKLHAFIIAAYPSYWGYAQQIGIKSGWTDGTVTDTGVNVLRSWTGAITATLYTAGPTPFGNYNSTQAAYLTFTNGDIVLTPGDYTILWSDNDAWLNGDSVGDVFSNSDVAIDTTKALRVSNTLNTGTTYTAAATCRPIMGLEYTPLENPPNAPTNLIPSGTSITPIAVKSLTPTLAWAFSDPDSGNTQSAFQVQVFNTNGTLLYDSQQLNSSNTNYTVPSSTGLQPNTIYSWVVRTWDNYSVVGPYSTNQYFKTSQAPTATNLTPGNANSTTPTGSSITPRLSWTYSDAEGDVQTAYQVKVYNPSTSLLVYDSQIVSSTNAYHDVPAGALGAGITFYWNVTVWDSTGMASNVSYSAYILTNNPPAPVTLVSPTDNYRVNLRPVFLANIGDDVENDKQNFKLQLADDSAFTVNLKEYSTVTSVTGWEANNGTSWVALPSGGTDSTYEGKQVRYTMQSDLTEGKTYYWRMAPIDGTTSTVGSWSSTRRIRVGTMLQFKLKTPITTTAAAKKIVLVGRPKIPTDGITPATLKVEVCNNGLDSTPTWEDATTSFTSGAYYVFTNATKTNANWAVDCRVTITANDSLGAMEFDGIGLSFA